MIATSVNNKDSKISEVVIFMPKRMASAEFANVSGTVKAIRISLGRDTAK